jgi:hypothetical protein
MNRFESATHPGMYWAIGLAIAAVFVVDMYTPIGIATWILYLIPLMLCFRVAQAWLPALVASISRCPGSRSASSMSSWIISARRLARCT